MPIALSRVKFRGLMKRQDEISHQHLNWRMQSPTVSFQLIPCPRLVLTIHCWEEYLASLRQLIDL